MSETEDIVARLRAWAIGADQQGVQEVSDGLKFAADEIERLRTQLEMWQDGNIMAESHSEEIERLRAERDEARREILLWVKERCSWAELSQEIEKRGWEYLKEDGK